MNTALTKQELAARCPAIFGEPSPEVGKHYTHVPTFKMLKVLEEVGYVPVKVMQKGKSRFGKHMVRLRHRDYLFDQIGVNDLIPEIVMINSHDTTAAFNMLAGIFRVVCANGMVVSDGPVSTKKFRHISVEDEMIMSVEDIKESVIPVAFEDVKKMQTIDLSDLEMLAFAEEAVGYRFDFPVETDKVLAVRRPEDEGKNLWNVLSRVQENLIKGGYEITRKKTVDAVPVSDVDKDLSINKKLWSLAKRVMDERTT